MKYIHIITFALMLLAVSAQGQLFIGDGASVYLTDATGGTLGQSETDPNLVALYVDGDLTVDGENSYFRNTGTEVQITGDLYFQHTAGLGLVGYKSTGDEVFNGSTSQTLTVSKSTNNKHINNFIVDKPSGEEVIINGAMMAKGKLYFEDGGNVRILSGKNLELSLASGNMTVGHGTAGAFDKMVITEGTGMIGGVPTAGMSYTFPVGASSTNTGDKGDGIQLLTFKPNTISGYLWVRFVKDDNTGVSVPFSACDGVDIPESQVERILDNGYWVARFLNASNFDATLEPADYTSGDDYTLLVDNAPTFLDPCDSAMTALPITQAGIAHTNSGYEDMKLSIGVADGNNIDLPVELLDFYGVKLERGNRLVWNTASEENASHFEVERSANGHDFDRIGTVNAVGFSTDIQEYEFKDKVASSSFYYRLNMVDLDGTAEYSNVIFLGRAGENDSELDMAIFPNPATEAVKVRVEGANNQGGQVSITNLLGKVVLEQTISNIGQGEEFTFDVSNLSKGMYTLTVVAGNNKRTQRFVKK